MICHSLDKFRSIENLLRGWLPIFLLPVLLSGGGLCILYMVVCVMKKLIQIRKRLNNLTTISCLVLNHRTRIVS